MSDRACQCQCQCQCQTSVDNYRIRSEMFSRSMFVHFLFLCYHAFAVDIFSNVVGLVQQQIASVFVGRFRQGLH